MVTLKISLWAKSSWILGIKGSLGACIAQEVPQLRYLTILDILFRRLGDGFEDMRPLITWTVKTVPVDQGLLTNELTATYFLSRK